MKNIGWRIINLAQQVSCSSESFEIGSAVGGDEAESIFTCNNCGEEFFYYKPMACDCGGTTFKENV
jgi:hypothetical protein